MKWALAALCIIRMVGNEVYDQTNVSAYYFMSQAIFETGILILLYRLFDGWVRKFTVFCIGASATVFLREALFFFGSDFLGDPTNVKLPDRLIFWAGGFLLLLYESRLLVKLYRKWKKSKN